MLVKSKRTAQWAALVLLAAAWALAPTATADESFTVTTMPSDEEGTPFVFEPQVTRIAVGDTVRFVNGDGVYHSVTRSNETDRNVKGDGFDQVLSSQGQAFNVTFDQEQLVRFFCQPHASFMWGYIVVGDAEEPPSDQVRGVQSQEPPGGADTPAPGAFFVPAVASLIAARRRASAKPQPR